MAPGGWPTSAVLRPRPSWTGSPVSVMIGPEGGLTEAERMALTAVGFRPVALGRHTLRFETAALAAAAAVAQARMRGLHG